jgi:hypothetical protein
VQPPNHIFPWKPKCSEPELFFPFGQGTVLLPNTCKGHALNGLGEYGHLPQLFPPWHGAIAFNEKRFGCRGSVWKIFHIGLFMAFWIF